MDDNFLFPFFWDITVAQNALGNKLKSFPDFLSTLSDERLLFYSNTVDKVLTSKQDVPEADDIQKVILLYSLILKEIECKTENDGSIQMSEDGSWVAALFMFLTLEKFRRDGHIKEYSGCLYDESIEFIPSEEMKKMSKGMSDILADAVSQLTKKQK